MPSRGPGLAFLVITHAPATRFKPSTRRLSVCRLAKVLIFVFLRAELFDNTLLWYHHSAFGTILRVAHHGTPNVCRVCRVSVPRSSEKGELVTAPGGTGGS